MDIALYLKFLLALVFVLALIGLLAWAARRVGLGGRLATAGSARRLAVVEVLPLDARHRLVLLRRDNREHLVLLGAGQGLLLEGGLPATATKAPAPTALKETGA